MKALKYIGIGVLILLGIFIGPALVGAFGLCAAIGFIVICALDSMGLVKIDTNNFNVIAGISFTIGLVLLLIYCMIAGVPEI